MQQTDNQRGVSLIETLIVLVVIGILVALAVVTLGKSPNNLRRQAVAREFKVSLERARFNSIRRRASTCSDMSRVEITSPTSFTLITDQDQDGNYGNQLQDPDRQTGFRFGACAGARCLPP